MKRKEYFGQCAYHWGQPVSGLRAVQLTSGKEWYHSQAICANCRKQLLGFFRYAKSLNSPYERIRK